MYFPENELLESKVMNLSDTIVHFKYPYKESYGEGVFQLRYGKGRTGISGTGPIEETPAGQDVDNEVGSIS